MKVHLYKPARDGPARFHGGHPELPISEWSLVAVDDDSSCCAFSLLGATETFFIVKMPPKDIPLIEVLNHEHLHLTFNRIGERRASHRLDIISNHDEWRERGVIGGL
jgi:hypothetical protein